MNRNSPQISGHLRVNPPIHPSLRFSQINDPLVNRIQSAHNHASGRHHLDQRIGRRPGKKALHGISRIFGTGLPGQINQAYIGTHVINL